MNTDKHSAFVSTDDIFNAVTQFQTGELSKAEALETLSRSGSAWLSNALESAGISTKRLPENIAVLSNIYLGVNGEAFQSQRRPGPITTEGLIAGAIFEQDNPDVVTRVPFMRNGCVEIWDVLIDNRGRTSLIQHAVFDHHELVHHDLSHVPDGEVPGDTPGEESPKPHGKIPGEKIPGEKIPGEMIPVADTRSHYRFNLKLVMWIPYTPNEIMAFRKFLPKPLRNEKMSQITRLALRIALATGNPEPPDMLDNKAYMALVASKEFRGALNGNVTLCCGNANPKGDDTFKGVVGFTPPASSAKPEDLVTDHMNTQNIGSTIKAILKSDSPLKDQLVGAGTGAALVDQIEDALDLIDEDLPGSDNVPPEAYTSGELITGRKKGTLSLDESPVTYMGNWANFVRIGPVNNLLGYALTGKLVAYQGGVINWKIDCNGNLSIVFNHSAVPSYKLYLNDKKIYEYDMIKSSIKDIEDTFFKPELKIAGVDVGGIMPNEVVLLDSLTSKRKAPLTKTFKETFSLNSLVNCPLEEDKN